MRPIEEITTSVQRRLPMLLRLHNVEAPETIRISGCDTLDFGNIWGVAITYRGAFRSAFKIERPASMILPPLLARDIADRFAGWCEDVDRKLRRGEPFEYGQPWDGHFELRRIRDEFVRDGAPSHLIIGRAKLTWKRLRRQPLASWPRLLILWAQRTPAVLGSAQP